MMTRTPKTAKKKSDAENVADAENAADVEVEQKDPGAYGHMRQTAYDEVIRIRNALQKAADTRSELSNTRLKIYKRSVESASVQFLDQHQQLLAQLSVCERQNENAIYQEFRTFYEDTLTELESALERQSTTLCSMETESKPVVENAHVVVQTALPRAIPKFSGRYEEWHKFKVMFKDVVDKTNEPPRIKLYHLEKALSGEAATVIDIKTINDGNYDHAWQLLEERYDDRRKLVDLYIKGLLSMEKIKHESFENLRKLVMSVEAHVSNLRFLGEHFDSVSKKIVIYIISQCLDHETRKQWESTVPRNEYPKYEETISFLKSRVSVLERCNGNDKQEKQLRFVEKPGRASYKANTVISEGQGCAVCKASHETNKCPELIRLNVKQRGVLLRKHGLCFVCLKRGHWKTNCKSTIKCEKCNGSHHTIMHYDHTNRLEKQTVAEVVPNSDTAMFSVSQHSQVSTMPRVRVLLQTALVNVVACNGKLVQCRAMLDTGSQISCITRQLVDRLGWKMTNTNIPVTGIGNVRSSVSKCCSVTVKSNCRDFVFDLTCLVYDEITGILPASYFSIVNLKIPDHLDLADPEFNKPGTVDLLIGMDRLPIIMKSGFIRVSNDLPIVMDTELGWVVGGCVDTSETEENVHTHVAVSDNIDRLLQRFWEIEEISSENCVRTEAERCEEHFQLTHKRDENGKYIVRLPLKESIDQLGDSRSMALRRFFALEKQLERRPDLRLQYSSFMEEYESMGHCKLVNESFDAADTKRWYLPHHAVLNPGKTTTKCRVVFDASAKVNGTSLNDVMMAGPTVQPDLFSIQLRFRMHRYVVSADVAKMFRQIKVDPSDTPLQRIFWRAAPSNPIRTLELTTVTYGTSAAPFLATRTLLQLAADEQERFPLASRVVKENFYVDDGLFGANQVDELLQIQQQLIQLFKSAGMHLHKWASNVDSLLHEIPREDQDSYTVLGESKANEIIKTLGIRWNPTTDEFIFITPQIPEISSPTKREVLSALAKIFDPLGLISPVVVLAKMLMQRLWKAKVGWDEKIDDALLKDWINFIDALPSEDQIRIPRHIVNDTSVIYEIHGFADASDKAYGACIYIRSINSNGHAEAQLVTSKSKVAPISPTTIPRKELMAALLLCRLTVKVVDVLFRTSFQCIHLWSDSQVVLAWLKKPLDRLEVFVRNRVAEITSHSEFTWSYVNTASNPADIVSRGQAASELAKNDLWWKGPAFLSECNIDADHSEDLPDDAIPELRSELMIHVALSKEEFPFIIRYESFRKVQRVMAYVLRFLANARRKRQDRIKGSVLLISELKEASRRIVGIVQKTELSDVIAAVRNGSRSHRYANLNLFLQDGLLRVGGRLQHSQLPFETRHQILLPNTSVITTRIINMIHRENLHVGCSGVISILRQQYWLANARSTVRKVLRGCVVCFRANPTTISQRMGNLPAYRVNSAPTFERVGLDYAGPIMLRSGLRRISSTKGYICIFVCMVTKGIHLEAVENLSTEAFLAAFKRFVSRRGIPQEVFSDNGTNFVGANAELRVIRNAYKAAVAAQGFVEYCQVKEINWKHIPPNAPHFGGIWEAGVKSVKSVLKRVYKTASLTIFEFYTLLCQIEAILNSRPLYAHSSDPQDRECLTPAYFMINRPLVGISEPSYVDISENRLNSWQRIQQLRDQFWARWAREYLSELQVRSKWTTQHANVKRERSIHKLAPIPGLQE